MIFNSIGDSSAAAMMDDAATPSVARKHNTSHPHEGGDGSSIEVAKRPRGRPPGSKNKPRPPIIITRSADPCGSLLPHILEIPSGRDVIDSIVKFSRRRSLGVCVLSGNGAVTDVSLRQPTHPTAGAGAGAAATVGLRGRFEILSLSATVMPPASSAVFATGTSVTLAGPQGQVMGGTVVGPLMAAGTVTVVAATFDNPTFHRLPLVDDDASRSLSVSGGGEDSSGQHQHEQEQEQEQEEEEAEAQHFVHREYPHHHHNQQQAVAESCGMAIYSSHFPSDVIWAPAARQPQPPPY